MKVYREISLYEFKPWSGAVSVYERILDENRGDEFESLIEELYPNGLSETELNDLLWFEPKMIFDALGIDYDEEE